MDKALKQRLVGATVIIALAVIVLPMLLSGKPESDSEQSQKMEIQPRPNELSFETRRFPVTGVQEESHPGTTASVDSDSSQQKLPALPATSASAETEKVAADTTQQTPAEGTGPEVETGAQLPVDAESVDVDTSVAPVAAPQSPLPGEEIPAATPVDGTWSPGARDEAGLAPAVNPTAAASNVQDAKAEGRYVVQVASLSSAENALKLAAQLQKQGFEVLSDTVESDVGRLNRVRVGPFARETEAAAASARIKQEFKGVSPRVLDLQPDLATQVTNPADPLVRWVVQLGVFNDSGNAQKLVDQLRSDGTTAYLETIKTRSVTTYRVRAGPFLERDAAIRTQQQLSDHLKIDGVVMSAD